MNCPSMPGYHKKDEVVKTVESMELKFVILLLLLRTMSVKNENTSCTVTIPEANKYRATYDKGDGPVALPVGTSYKVPASTTLIFSCDAGYDWSDDVSAVNHQVWRQCKEGNLKLPSACRDKTRENFLLFLMIGVSSGFLSVLTLTLFLCCWWKDKRHRAKMIALGLPPEAPSPLPPSNRGTAPPSGSGGWHAICCPGSTQNETSLTNSSATTASTAVTEQVSTPTSSSVPATVTVQETPTDVFAQGYQEGTMFDVYIPDIFQQDSVLSRSKTRRASISGAESSMVLDRNKEMTPDLDKFTRKRQTLPTSSLSVEKKVSFLEYKPDGTRVVIPSKRGY